MVVQRCRWLAWASWIGLAVVLPLDVASAHWRHERAPRPAPHLAEAQRQEAAGHAALTAGGLERACAAWERALQLATGPRGLGVRSRVHYNLANVLRVVGEPERAGRHYTEARAGFVQLGDRLNAARALHNGGIVSEDLGDGERALAAYEHALEAFADCGSDQDAAIALNSLGVLFQARGELRRSRVCLERALEVGTTLGDASARLQALNNLGNTYSEMGENGLARGALEEAARIAREFDLPELATSVTMNLSALDFAAGRYAEALAGAERALREYVARGDEASAGQVLSNLGGIHAELGDFAAARTCYEQAIEKAETAGDPYGMANAVGNLGLLHETLGNAEEALACFEASLELEEMLERPLGVAETLVNMGALFLDLERLDAARSAFEKALALFEQTGSRVDEARALNNLASVQGRLGNVQAAIPLYQRALAIVEESGAPEAEARMRWGLAGALEAEGRAPEALDHLRRAVTAAARMGQGLEEEQGSRAREVWFDLFQAGVAAAVRAERPEDVFFFLESGRAGVLLEALGAQAALRTALIPAPLREAEAVAARRHDAAVAGLRRARAGEDLDVLEAARAELASARDRLAGVAGRVRREVKAGAELLDPTPVPFSEAQSGLAADEALVLYGLTSDQAVALVVTRTAARIVPLGATSTIESGCAKVVLDDPAIDPAPALEVLRRLVAKPLELPMGVKRAIVSPHGALAQVPLALLLSDHEVLYVPSATSCARLRRETTRRGDRVLALGDPDYRAPRDEGALALLRSGANLPPLPGSRAEAEAVGDVLLLGRDATERGLREQLASGDRWRAVHLTCHGLIDPERPLFSSLALTPEAGDDGLLTVLEVFRMDVRADLVALSACETARGKDYRAEGILGLTHAFLCAGTPRVLCSLWEVDDAATKALMTRFYELWRPEGGLDAPTALRQAQADVRAREGWSHPHYWAAWVLWGPPDG